MKRLSERIAHVNPNCKDSRFCLPHGEHGPVDYVVDIMLHYIHKLEEELECKEPEGPEYNEPSGPDPELKSIIDKGIGIGSDYKEGGKNG